MNTKDLRDSVENAIEKTYLFTGDFHEAADAAIRAVLEFVADDLSDIASVTGRPGESQPDLADAADHFRILAGGAS